MSAQAGVRAAPSSSGKTGMKVFVISDGFAFAGLLFAYAVLRAGKVAGPPLEPAPSALFAGALAGLLLASSASLARAGSAEGGRRALYCGLAAALGLLFCAAQAYEWRELAGAGLGLGTSPRAGLFYVLTGYHGLHVLAGAVALGVLAARSPSKADVATVAIYWHFVDLIWLFLVVALYLL